MTVIFAAKGPGGVLLGSDTLLTPYSGDVAQPRLLPSLTPRLISGEPMPQNVSDLCTKIVRISPNHVLLWSGDPLAARLIAQEISTLIVNNSYEGLNHAIDKSALNDREKSGLSLLMVCQISGEYLFELHGDFLKESRDNIEFIISGSGAWPFFSDILANQSITNQKTDHWINDLTKEIFGRIALTIYREGGDPSHLHYGAWFDLIIGHSHGFSSADFAIHTRTWTGAELLINEPTIFSFFDDEDLHVVSIFENRVRGFSIPPITNRTKKLPNLKLGRHYPFAQLHLLANTETGKLFVDIQNGKSSAMEIIMNENGVSFRSSEDYYNWILRNIDAINNNEPFDVFSDRFDS